MRAPAEGRKHNRMSREKPSAVPRAKQPAKAAAARTAAAAPSFRRERALIKRGVWPVAAAHVKHGTGLEPQPSLRLEPVEVMVQAEEIVEAAAQVA